MGKAETRLTNHMRDDGHAVYGRQRLVIIKYHGDEYGRAGVSDLLGTLDGAFWACEVKSPESSKHKRKTMEASIEHAMTHGPTDLQREFIRKVQAANGYAWVAVTREQFLEGLAAVDAMNRERCAYCQFPTEYIGATGCLIHPPLEPVLL